MSRKRESIIAHFDWFTLVTVFALVAFGLISLASIMATPFTGEEQGLSAYVEKLNLEYVVRQAQNFMVGIAAMLVILVFDYEIYKPLINYAYIGIIALLALLYAVGAVRGGAQAWFALDRLNRALQPSEIGKVVLIIMLSKYVSKGMEKTGKLHSFKDIAIALGVALLPIGLVAVQPDLGTAAVYAVIMIFILFIGRISWKWIGISLGVFAFAVVAAYIVMLKFFDISIFEYVADRFTSFANPEADPLGAGYHMVQSKMAIGSGQMWGKGFFSAGTLAQLHYVPERHTDFIFAGIGEGVGFVGGAAVIVAYFVLLFRWMWISYRARDSFGACIAAGCMAMILAHVFENIGMNIGLMPVTGIPLPFISYGGSNLLASMMCVGLVINVNMRRFKER